MKISVIIPTLNEEKNIGAVLDKIPSALVDEVLVVDGGSKDRTASIAKERGAVLIEEARRGYGFACAAGAFASTSDVLVFMDADGADDPSHIKELIQPILDSEMDMVLGSRLGGSIDAGAMNWHQYFGNWLSARLFNLFYGLQISDLSPFRAVDRKKLLDLQMQEMTFGWPTEMIAKAARMKWRICEIPVDYHPRQGGESKISGTLRGTVLAAFFILRTIMRYRKDPIR
jgi:glycosyltransferase involved in cell wall biosynthesis